MTRLGGATPAVIATVLVLALLYLTRSVMEPVAFALFVIALAAPLQAILRRWLPGGLALIVTIIVVLCTVAVLVLLVTWSIGALGQWVLANMGRFQATYARGTGWLAAHDILVGPLAQRFDARWIAGPLRTAAGTVREALGFLMLAFVFVVLGLSEIVRMPARLRALQGDKATWDPAATAAVVAAKFRRYMGVRTVASVLTGAATAAIAAVMGVEKPLAWGVLTFALNFLPFIGGLVVVVLITAFTAAQFGTWQAPLVMLAATTTAQFVIGSYLEPVLAGAALAMSPFVVLFAVFFWGLLWGMPGAFLGVPIVILLLTVCAQFPRSRWIAVLLAGGGSALLAAPDDGASGETAASP